MLNFRSSGFSRLFFATCGLVVAAGCAEDHDDDFRQQEPLPPAVRSTLQLNWTIDGTRDPALCERISAVSFNALISNQGFLVTELLAPCPDFQTQVSLWVDGFVVRAALVDASKRLATGRIVQDQVRLVADQVTVLTIDFPSSATMPLSEDAGTGTDAGTDAGAEPDAAANAPGAADAGAPDAGDAGLDAAIPPGS
jgi:hypothetical protein